MATRAGGLTLKRRPVQLDSCPHCKQVSRTRIKTYPSFITWALCLALIFVFWPICWIPLVVDSVRVVVLLCVFPMKLLADCGFCFRKAKQTDHFCVLCQAKIGGVRPLQDCCEKERE
mmetsp:Transcript_32041/g.48998  ORF Transcript_32041/g.48998 Transcript_32041/m.48998 type:complete len:117 (+) Transcript_32041:295-645(+)